MPRSRRTSFRSDAFTFPNERGGRARSAVPLGLSAIEERGNVPWSSSSQLEVPQMSDFAFDLSKPTILAASDLRRLPIVGSALGLAIAATVLAAVERGPIPMAIGILLWVAAAVLLLAVTPFANSLTIDREGFRLRSRGVQTGFVPWRDVASLEAGDGWAEATVIVELVGDDGRTIPGLPFDADLGHRSFTDHYGLDASELLTLLARWRTADTRALPGGDPHPAETDGARDP